MAAAFASTAYVPQSNAATTASSVKFQINQHSYVNNTGKHSLAVAPYALHGNVMVPLRALAESLGAGISWNQASQTATLSGQAFGQIKLKVNAKIAVNEKGEQIKLPESVKQDKRKPRRACQEHCGPYWRESELDVLDANDHDHAKYRSP